MALIKILLAEDDEDDQLLFHEFLAHRTDIELLPIAENGVVLFDKLDQMLDHKDLPHIIILDQNMPKLNGMHTLKLLKEHPRYHVIPVVIYSTYTDANLVDSCTAQGACAVLAKPITKNGYDEMINTCLQVVGAQC